jgi:Ca2+-transporting ATPase
MVKNSLPIYTWSVSDALKTLDTTLSGLTEEEALKRLKEHGPNRLSEPRKIAAINKLLSQFKDLFSVLLLIAALLAFISGMVEFGFAVFLVVVLNAIMSFVQEFRAEKAVKALKRFLPFRSTVIRDGEPKEVQADEIVPGDLLILEEGDRVPADARVLESFDLSTNNVALTGESEPQPRDPDPMPGEATSWLDVTNLVFMGTTVASGYAKAAVYNTGMETQFGKIAGMSEAIEEAPSPLQNQISYAAKVNFALAIGVGILFLTVGTLWLHMNLYTGFLFMIGVMIACVPEGLQVTVSTALALGVVRLARRNVLVKRLSAVETLGSTSVICTDKTGTITKGEMTVRKIWIDDLTIDVTGEGYAPSGELHGSRELRPSEQKDLEMLIEVMALCNNAKLVPPTDRNDQWKVVGDPTEGSLLTLALKLDMNIRKELADKPIVELLPFDSVRKRMTSIHKTQDGYIAYVKGAPKETLTACSHILVGSEVRPLTQTYEEKVNTEKRLLGEEGLRVLAAAFRKLPSSPEAWNIEAIERNLVFIGLVGILDPPRPEVKDAVQEAKNAGIRVFLITGDYGPTALTIAQKVGIVESDRCDVLTGAQLNKLSEPDLIRRIDTEEIVFARATPEHKMRIVSLLKSMGEVVAVTGDGANDAPSLKKADIGISMGMSGTDVARESADMILLDDSFASISRAIEGGRAVYDNIRKFVTYVFAHNWAELIPYLLFVLISIPLPLLVTQILAIDLGIEVIPSLALSVEPPELDIMKRPPRSRKERLFDSRTIARSLFLGAFVCIVGMVGCLVVWMQGGWRYGLGLSFDDPIYRQGTTMTLAGIVVAQSANLFACRAARTSIAKVGLFSNKWIWLGIASQIVILSGIVYLPILQEIFGTYPLTIQNWGLLLMLAPLPLLAEEARKKLSRSTQHG